MCVRFNLLEWRWFEQNSKNTNQSGDVNMRSFQKNRWSFDFEFSRINTLCCTSICSSSCFNKIFLCSKASFSDDKWLETDSSFCTLSSTREENFFFRFLAQFDQSGQVKKTEKQNKKHPKNTLLFHLLGWPSILYRLLQKTPSWCVTELTCECSLVVEGGDWRGKKKKFPHFSWILNTASQIFFILAMHQKNEWNTSTHSVFFYHMKKWFEFKFHVIFSLFLGRTKDKNFFQNWNLKSVIFKVEKVYGLEKFVFPNWVDFFFHTKNEKPNSNRILNPRRKSRTDFSFIFQNSNKFNKTKTTSHIEVLSKPFQKLFVISTSGWKKKFHFFEVNLYFLYYYFLNIRTCNTNFFIPATVWEKTFFTNRF